MEHGNGNGRRIVSETGKGARGRRFGPRRCGGARVRGQRRGYGPARHLSVDRRQADPSALPPWASRPDRSERGDARGGADALGWVVGRRGSPAVGGRFDGRDRGRAACRPSPEPPVATRRREGQGARPRRRTGQRQHGGRDPLALHRRRRRAGKSDPVRLAADKEQKEFKYPIGGHAR